MRNLAPLLKHRALHDFRTRNRGGIYPMAAAANAPVSTHGIAEWAAIAVIVVGILDLRSHCLLGLCLDGRRNTGADCADQSSRGKGPAPLRTQPDVPRESRSSSPDKPGYFTPGTSRFIWRCMLRDCRICLSCFMRNRRWKRQFGEEYERYRARVPRWIPEFEL